jgi:hypothetical protein
MAQPPHRTPRAPWNTTRRARKRTDHHERAAANPRQRDCVIPSQSSMVRQGARALQAPPVRLPFNSRSTPVQRCSRGTTRVRQGCALTGPRCVPVRSKRPRSLMARKVRCHRSHPGPPKSSSCSIALTAILRGQRARATRRMSTSSFTRCAASSAARPPTRRSPTPILAGAGDERLDHDVSLRAGRYSLRLARQGEPDAATSRSVRTRGDDCQ